MNFECRNCGECCSNYLPLQEQEIKRMKELAQKENKHLIRQDWYDRCPFLNNNNKCDIYSDRPLICREYTCYKFKNNIYETEKFKDIKPSEFRVVNLREEFFGKGK